MTRLYFRPFLRALLALFLLWVSFFLLYFFFGIPDPEIYLIFQVKLFTPTAKLDQQTHIVPLDKETNLNLLAYNFSDTPVSGTITVEHAPQGCKLTPDRWEITLEPMGQKRLPARVTINASGSNTSNGGWLKLRGDFANAGRPVLAFRLVPK